MSEFLSYLAWIRKQNNINRKSFLTKLLIVYISTITISFLFDTFIPWNIVTTTIRCLFALILSLVLFTTLYAFSQESKKFVYFKFLDNYRREFSINQRINISLIVSINSFILHFLLVKPHNTAYTLASSLIMVLWISLVYFLRPTYEEMNFFKLDMEDVRDVIYEGKLKEKQLEKNKKLKEKEKEKE